MGNVTRWIKQLVVLVAATGLIGPAATAHTLSVIVTKPYGPTGGKTTVYLCWGHRLPVDELVDGSTLTSYEIVSPSGTVTKLTPDSGRTLQAFEFSLTESGVYQVSVVRTPTVVTMWKDGRGGRGHHIGPKSEVTLPEGGEFTASLRSRQFAKALAVAGDAQGPAPGPLGLPIELVVVSDLSSLQTGSTIKVQALFNGQPLADASITAASAQLNPDGRPELTIKTNAQGIAEFTPAHAGTWILGVGQRLPAPADLQSQFDQESYSATLSLGIRED